MAFPESARKLSESLHIVVTVPNENAPLERCALVAGEAVQTFNRAKYRAGWGGECG
jgi:hypothetical protein